MVVRSPASDGCRVAGGASPDLEVLASRRHGPVIGIAGPTASGKSSLAIRLARLLDTIIVSADAMQVYRGMDVGTAKDHDFSQGIRMVDVVDPWEDYSVALYQPMARAEVDACLRVGRTPIICGGTGLYFDAIVDEISFPQGDTHSESRRRWERLAREQGADALFSELVRRDPDAAGLIHPNNVRRVVRALEMADQGVSYARQNERLHQRQAHYDAHIFAITMDRERLRRRICERVDVMIEQGLVHEVRGLADRGLRRSRTACQAIGYKEILAHIDGACTLEESIAQIKVRSCRYAKRQASWLRRRTDVTWIDYETLDERAAVDLILSTVPTLASCDSWLTGAGGEGVGRGSL